MKFNKKNPKHYIKILSYSSLFIFMFVITLIFKKPNNYIFLMGHQLSGNLGAFFEKKNEIDYEVFYMTFNLKLSKNNENILYFLNLKSIFYLLNSLAIISSHGIIFHSLINKKKIKTIHIGHGVQTSVSDFTNSAYYKYTEVWLNSEFDKEILEKDCMYTGNNLISTGYLKTQNIINNEKNKSEMKDNLNMLQKYILYAPTATGKLINNSKENFQFKNIEFLEKLNKLSSRFQYKTVIKLHYNNHEFENIDLSILEYIRNSSNLIYFKDIALKNFDDLLNICDLLITDWSSIYVDYILLDKPMFFIDAPLRREEIIFSKYFDNEFIKRIDNFDVFEKAFIDLNRDSKSFIYNDLKNIMFKNEYTSDILSKYMKRLEG